MTREEARLILDANTLESQQVGENPALMEARKVMELDAELRSWFEERQRFDNSLAAVLCADSVPEGLKERIHSSLEASPRARSSIFKVWMTLAAAVALAAVWLTWTTMKAPSGDRWITDSLSVMTHIETDPPRVLDVATHDMGVVRALLARSGAPLPANLPKTLVPGSTVGCKVFEIKGHKATIICFEVEPGVVAHLAVVEGVVNLNQLPKDHPLFAAIDGWNTAEWSGDGRAYLMATKGTAAILKKLFA